jgi:hypothetical protein
MNKALGILGILALLVKYFHAMYEELKETK